MITHFYSDPHFGHANIIEYAGRPFRDVHEMDYFLENQYLNWVHDDDTVVYGGDVSFHDLQHTRDLLRRLPGYKILVRGNHDGTIAHCLKMGFDMVVDSLHLEIAGHKVTVVHKPIKPGPGEYVIHGHTHDKLRKGGRFIHVGVDAWNFRPVLMSEVENLIKESVESVE